MTRAPAGVSDRGPARGARGAGTAVVAEPNARRCATGVVVACVLATAISPATLVNMPFGLFIPELEREFHWPRVAITAALTVFLVVLIVLLPFVGSWIDRLGARRLAVPSIAGYALLLASLSLCGPSQLQFYGTFAAIAAVGVAAQSVSFIKVLSNWFDRRRGLAIGLCMAGFGIGFAVVPLITHWLIVRFGWRLAYVGLGCLALLVPLPAVYLFLHDAPPHPGGAPDDVPCANREAAAGPAISLRDALRTRELWLLASSFALASFALNGLQSQLVPLLGGRGFLASDAALVLSAIGVGSFPGRVLVGWLIDHFFAPRLTVLFYAAAAVAIAVVTAGGKLPLLLGCAVVIGVSIGAENDVLGYLAGRYFGLQSFGEVYAVLLGSYLIGAAAGPLAMAWSYDLSRDYAFGLGTAIGLLVLSSILLLMLGGYATKDPHVRR